MKKFRFVNASAKKDFLDLPTGIQKQFGTDLNAVQNDKRPFSDFKNIAGSVGPGAIELIENGSPAYRVVYCAKFEETIFILHAFTKTTNGVDQKAMNTAKLRYSEMVKLIKKERSENR